MTGKAQKNELQANTLCKSCGLCCTGHLFIWIRLKASELDRSQALGLNVIRSDPRQRGFTQPCPLWRGIGTIYDSPDYPRVCRNYQCNLLKELLDEKISLPHASSIIQQTKQMIRKLEVLLPASRSNNFRERLVAFLEGQEEKSPDIHQMAEDLVALYERTFGVQDLFDKPDRQHH